MIKISKIKAREVLDSRGMPTIEADIFEDNIMGRASIPSGASTGSLEAIELRDNDKNRYFGKGVQKAIDNINNIIAPKLLNKNISSQKELDSLLIKLDGTKNKSNLGANAILAISLAFARLSAKKSQQPLYAYLANGNGTKMPVPMMNILNGGSHANNSIDIQEFMIMPLKAKNITEAIRIGAEIFYHLKKILQKNNHSTSVGDEGGFAPNLSSSKEALDYILIATKNAGYKIGEEIQIALDVAASEFYKNGKYHLENKILSNLELIEYYSDLCDKYPIFSIEDALAENDYIGWKLITQKLKIQLVGDDLFVTNPKILQKGIIEKMANAILIKPNQIGTLSETLETINIANNAGYKTIISHRSGETEDNIIAHIAVATKASQIKTGSLSRSDRTAKYNELIRIEEELANEATYGL